MDTKKQTNKQQGNKTNKEQAKTNKHKKYIYIYIYIYINNNK